MHVNRSAETREIELFLVVTCKPCQMIRYHSMFVASTTHCEQTKPFMCRSSATTFNPCFLGFLCALCRVSRATQALRLLLQGRGGASRRHAPAAFAAAARSRPCGATVLSATALVWLMPAAEWSSMHRQELAMGAQVRALVQRWRLRRVRAPAPNAVCSNLAASANDIVESKDE